MKNNINNLKLKTMLTYLSENELKNIYGGNLWDDWMKDLEDAGQYVGGFIGGLFTGDCPC